MSKFNLYTDDIENSEFINKDILIEKYGQESIFGLVFDHIPNEFEYVTSPFRKDSNPGCWFSYDFNGKLRFIDFGNSEIIRGIKMGYIDCFDAVMIYFNIPTFRETLKFIDDNLFGMKADIKFKKEKSISKFSPSVKTEIFVKPRFYQKRDRKFWEPYGISKKQLEEDKVFPIDGFMIKSRKGNTSISTTNILSYAFTDFEKTKKKIYQPYDKKRFITNCTENDIGGIKDLFRSKQLIITKSYKDWRVLKNLALDTIWFQNEGMIPSDDILFPLLERYEDIIILYDSDKSGIMASKKVKEHLSLFSNFNIRNLHLPEKYLKLGIKDPSDFYKVLGKYMLVDFLKTKNIKL